MQESGAIDHFYAQEQRRRQQPQVFRIDTTESEEAQRAGQQAVPERPGAFGDRGLSPRLRATILRRPSSGERT